MGRPALPLTGPDDPRHGTLNGYSNLGCRCDPCKAAKSAYGRERYRRTSQEAQGSPAVRADGATSATVTQLHPPPVVPAEKDEVLELLSELARLGEQLDLQQIRRARANHQVGRGADRLLVAGLMLATVSREWARPIHA